VCKLSDEDRETIKGSTEPAAVLAARFGVSTTRVYQLRRAHLKEGLRS
jgi:hypothetical protein